MVRKWKSTKMEAYAENWWNQNGYSFQLKKENLHKSIYDVTKNDITMEFSVAVDAKNYEELMKLFENQFTTYCELIELRKEIAK